MINFDDYVHENKTEHNLNWSYTPDHPYRILIIGGSESEKTNALLKLINNQPDIDNIYLYAKDLYEAKYQFLISERESTGLKHLNDPKVFVEYSNNMYDLYKNINEHNPDRENKILIVFDDMIIDMINSKKLDSIVTELFIRGRKLKFLLFLSHNYILRFQKMLDWILLTFLSRKFQIKESWTIFVLVNDTTLASDNLLRFRKLFLKHNKNHAN